MRLAAFLREKRNQPFAWGKNDCCLFAADWVAALTGSDPAADLRGQYHTALGAQRILDAHGGVEGLAKERFIGWPEAQVTYARRGDVLVTDMEGRPALGVCAGAQAGFAGADGIIFHPLTSCRRAWRID